MIALSVIGLAASATISIEKTHLLQNPQTDLSCSINPVYSCQNVITSDQASIFGFSNELIGIAFFGGTLALGLGLLSGAKYSAWLHKLTLLGLLASMGVVIWFFYESVFVINAVCIYCSTVWLATWSLLVRYSVWLITSKTLAVPKKYRIYTEAITRYALAIWALLITVFAGLILNHFWYYYGQYF